MESRSAHGGGNRRASGQDDWVREQFERALAEKGETSMPYYPRWILGQLLESDESLRDVLIKSYEGALADQMYGRSHEFEFSSAVRLLNLYVAANRRDDAKALLAKAEKQKVGDGYDPEYAAERRVSLLTSLAQHYDRLDFPVDALRLYRDSLSGAQNPALTHRGNNEYYVRQAEQQLTALTARLAATENPTLLAGLLAPSDQPGKPAGHAGCRAEAVCRCRGIVAVPG